MTFEKFRHVPGKPVIFTDLETTGFKKGVHEIIEIGAVLTTPDLEIIDELNIKVKPLNIEAASPRALEVNGYDPEAWGDAIDLDDAIAQFNAMAVDATFVAHNAPYDWKFLEQAFEDTAIESAWNGHRICNLEFSRHVLKQVGLTSFTQAVVSEHLGLEPEPAIHRAVNGARLAHQIYGKLRQL